jgi:hypothetical protein
MRLKLDAMRDRLAWPAYEPPYGVFTTFDADALLGSDRKQKKRN